MLLRNYTAQECLVSCILPSPPSSIVLSHEEMSRVTDPTIRLAMLIDILRYVSPYPWGSYQAEAFRNSSSLNLITSKLWSDQWGDIRPFSAGAAVLWTPVVINSGVIKMQSSGYLHGSRAWLASRLPPYRNSGVADTIHLDLTRNYRQAILDPAATQPEQVLYDCRFLLTIDWAKFPEEVSQRLARSDTHYKLLVVPYTRYYLPRIVLRSSAADEPDVVLGTPCCSDSRTCGDVPNKGEFKDAGWARWEFIRRVSAD
jgi:tRNA(Ile)-lysidine synthase